MTRTSASVAWSTATASLGEKSPADAATFTSRDSRRLSASGERVSTACGPAIPVPPCPGSHYRRTGSGVSARQRPPTCELGGSALVTVPLT